MARTRPGNTVIVGAGIAGASTAYFLSRRRRRGIVLLDRETVPGAHSTGRNAAILRSAIPDPVLRGLAEESLPFFTALPAGFAPQPLLKRVGLYLAVRAEHSAALLACMGNGGRLHDLDPAPLYRRVPVLAPGIAAAFHRPDEGVIDIHELLQGFIRSAAANNAEVMLGCEALRISAEGGRVQGVETSRGFIAADQVILATGGWGGVIAEASGYPLPLVPHRRHLLVTEPSPNIDPDWPVVWLLGDEFYFRPESGGLLMSGCDTVAVSPEEGERTDASQIEAIAAKAGAWLPTLAESGVARAWAGMRTFARDNRFVIGPDPRLEGLVWVAALGGHGMTCSPAVGALAADWAAEGESRHPAARFLLPARLLA